MFRVYYTFDSVYDTSASFTVSLLAPGSTTHGTEMNQRMVTLVITERTTEWLTVRAPMDSTVMLTGHHLLFICNGNTPSHGAWVQLGLAPTNFEESNGPTFYPTPTPSTAIPTTLPTPSPTAAPSTAVPTEVPTVVPTEVPTEVYLTNAINTYLHVYAH